MQLITPDGIGHNVFEVFDPRDGWIIVDPSYGHVVFNARDEQNRRIHKRTRLPEGATVYGLHYRRTVAIHTTLLTGIASLVGALVVLASMHLYVARRRAKPDSSTADGEA